MAIVPRPLSMLAVLCGWAAAVGNPSVRVVSPAQGAVLRNSTVFIEMAVGEGFRLGVDGVVCLSVIWDKGKARECFDSLEALPLRLDGLESDVYALLASIEARPPGGSSEPRVLATAHSTFEVRAEREPPKIFVPFPRDGEKLSYAGAGRPGGVTRVEASLVALNFAHERGWICAAFDSEPQAQVGAWRAEAAAAAAGELGHGAAGGIPAHPLNCVPPNTTVVGGDLPVGRHVFVAELVDRSFRPLLTAQTAERVKLTRHQAVFTILPPPRLPAARAPGGAEVASAAVDARAGMGAAVHAIGSANGATQPPAIDASGGTVHIAVMSCRSHDRYLEALVMIKSLLLHLRARRLHLHLIVDAGGASFFRRALARMPAFSSAPGSGCACATMYDFDSTCGAAVDEFLRSHNFPVSSHYSGRAGYCRLFFPAIFQRLAPQLRRVIAVESDQLWFRDAADLWAEFDRFGTDAGGGAVVGMPEMHRPWAEGRGDFDARSAASIAKNTAVSRAALAQPCAYHGNGYIGGIIMLELQAMASTGWEQKWREVFLLWLAEQPMGWVPQLNDQDVFNAVFAKLPTAVHALPCEWNLQYHAIMAQMRVCGEGRPLNCDAALQKGIFVCPRPPGIVHFMAQSYRTTTPTYFSEFWDATLRVPDSIMFCPSGL